MKSEKLEENLDEKQEESNEKSTTSIVKPVSRSPSLTNFVDSNKKQYKLNLVKNEDGNKNKDFDYISGSFRKSPKIMIVNEDNDTDNVNEITKISDKKNNPNQDQTKSPQSNLDLNKNKSVSQFYS